MCCNGAVVEVKMPMLQLVTRSAELTHNFASLHRQIHHGPQVQHSRGVAFNWWTAGASSKEAARQGLGDQTERPRLTVFTAVYWVTRRVFLGVVSSCCLGLRRTAAGRPPLLPRALPPASRPQTRPTLALASKHHQCKGPPGRRGGQQGGAGRGRPGHWQRREHAAPLTAAVSPRSRRAARARPRRRQLTCMLLLLKPSWRA